LSLSSHFPSFTYFGDFIALARAFAYFANQIMSEQLTFPAESAALLEPRVPPKSDAKETSRSRPFVTLTFATSLDSSLSLAPGVRTRLSGPGSKAMTHYLRTRHSAILVGVSTVLADDPALNCRIAGTASQPRPIVIDANLRWTPRHSDKVFEVCRNGIGLAPFILTGVDESSLPRESVELLHEHGGKYIRIPASRSQSADRLRFDWNDILAALQAEGLSSVMVEGGGRIINSLLDPAYHDLIDSVIVTIAPTWLGQGGVVVSPDRVTDTAGVPLPVARLSHVSWHPFGEDVVLCGTLRE
jgi:2,5-diamino-6-(ribosylamino)-4(3H)-pyrimidinone 5'-phosphate reductase